MKTWVYMLAGIGSIFGVFQVSSAVWLFPVATVGTLWGAYWLFGWWDEFGKLARGVILIGCLAFTATMNAGLEDLDWPLNVIAAGCVLVSGGLVGHQPRVRKFLSKFSRFRPGR